MTSSLPVSFVRLALSPDEAGGGPLAEYLQTSPDEREIPLASLAPELTTYMREDIGEIERAAEELEAYFRNHPLS